MSYKGTAILGQATAQREQMEAHVRRLNPGAPDVAHLYLELGARLSIRGDLAFAQALHATDYFRGNAAARNNFGALGVSQDDPMGASFASPEEGVLAHLQRLFAYAGDAALPVEMKRVDPGFSHVPRASAPYVGDLSGRWSPDRQYGQKVDQILAAILMEPVPGEPDQITRAYLDPLSETLPGSWPTAAGWEGVRGIVVHRTGSPLADAWTIRGYLSDFAGQYREVTQFVVDHQQILQVVPIGVVAHHTPGKDSTHLGVAICEQTWGTASWSEAYQKLVWLCAYLVRVFRLSISDVTGHFWWDPVHHPYDPTCLGWTPQDGRARGLFDWNQFIADVRGRLERAESPTAFDVRISRVVQEERTRGLLIDLTPYVPLRPYTACLYPEANIRWDSNGRHVTVELPGQDQAEAPQGGAEEPGSEPPRQPVASAPPAPHAPEVSAAAAGPAPAGPATPAQAAPPTGAAARRRRRPPRRRRSPPARRRR